MCWLSQLYCTMSINAVQLVRAFLPHGTECEAGRVKTGIIQLLVQSSVL